MELNERVAVVTGAGSGIGKGLAHCLADAGMKIVLSGCNIESLESTAAELGSNETLCVAADVSNIEDVHRLADAALERFGEVHLLCNNAGVAMPGSTHETSIEDWRWAIAVNLWGPIHGVEVFLPIMERQKVGHINSTASESGLYGGAFLAAYNVSKFGVVGLMQSLERDLRARQSPVRASVFCPSAVKTAILDSARNRSSDSMREHSESEATQAFSEVVAEVVSGGMDAKEAASFVIEAIQADRFWIFSHPQVAETAFRQAKAMVGEETLIDL